MKTTILIDESGTLPKSHQKTTLADGLVNLTNLLNGWIDNLGINIP